MGIFGLLPGSVIVLREVELNDETDRGCSGIDPQRRFDFSNMGGQREMVACGLDFSSESGG